VRIGRVRDRAVRQSPGPPTQKSELLPVPDNLTSQIEGMMETFAAIVVTAVVVPLVFLGAIFVEVLTGFVLSFL
jgi:hypothetical protein